MLDNIYIKNFAIIDEQDVPFVTGFNVLSGETGAGKSILIDALGLQLGDRADSSWIRHGSDRCDIQSNYQLPENSQVKQWLVEHELDEDDDCQLRRTLSHSGKSKSYINGIPSTLSGMKQLGSMLVNIHGQHAHQSLTQPEKQLELLDQFAHHHELLATTKVAYQTWRGLLKQQKQLHDSDHNLADKRELLQYQLDELIALNLADNEFQQLVEEQQRLAAAHDILQELTTIDYAINGDNSLTSGLNQALRAAEKIQQRDSNSSEINELLNQALIYVEEAQSAVSRYTQSIELNPDELAAIELRMSTLYDMARKHHIEPQGLIVLQQQLQQQLEQLANDLIQLENIDADIRRAETNYQQAAKKLSTSRQQAAQRLNAAVNAKLSELGLENASFEVSFQQTQTAKPYGQEQIIFMFSPNPGQGMKPLHKIASGGELSRISLAIQVAGVINQSDVTLIFDEVDSGIGGATAEVVGRLLKTLSQYNQVICVTHLAQVAAFADQHVKIEKKVRSGQTFTQFNILDEKKRIEELARMSGGIEMDKKTLEHAQNMRHNAVQFSSHLQLK